MRMRSFFIILFFQAEDGIRDYKVTGVQTCALPICLWASRTDYWQSATITAYAVCDATNTVNLQVLRKQTGSISGQVVVQGGGPLSGVVVTVNGAEYLSVTTDTNGSFQFPVLQLNHGHVPAYYSVS